MAVSDVGGGRVSNYVVEVNVSPGAPRRLRMYAAVVRSVVGPMVVWVAERSHRARVLRVKPGGYFDVRIETTLFGRIAQPVVRAFLRALGFIGGCL